MSATMEFTEQDAPEKLREPKLIEKSICHLIVTDIHDLVNNDNVAYGFEIVLQVVASNVAGQEGKVFKAKFQEPSANHKDGGEFCTKRRKALVLATGLIPLPATGKIEIPWGSLVDMQFVAKVDQEPWQTDKTKFNNEIAGCSMWHIDEPAVANIPKNPTIVANCVGHRWTEGMIAAAVAKLAESGKQLAAGSGDKSAGKTAPAKQDWGSL